MRENHPLSGDNRSAYITADVIVTYFDWLSDPIPGEANFAARGIGKVD